MYASTLTVTAALAALAHAGTFYVDNLCDFEVYLQSSVQDPAYTGPLVTLPAQTTNAYNEVQRDSSNNNNALTLSLTPDLANPLQAVYTQNDNGLTYYDLSTIYGDPFMTEGYELLSGAGDFDIVCPPSSDNNCPNTYNPSNPNGDNAVFTQPVTADFALRLCKSGNSTSDVVPS